MIQSTTPTIQGKEITKYHGVVTGEAILGANIFKDIFAKFADKPFPEKSYMQKT